ncbi:MAG: protein kinase domain-containing protein [bacterium]
MYNSPEVWKDLPYDNKSDIWSLGCVLYEIASLKPPFRADDMEGLYKKVIRGFYPKIPSQYSQDLSNTIRALLQVNPKLRPNCGNFHNYRLNSQFPKHFKKNGRIPLHSSR